MQIDALIVAPGDSQDVFQNLSREFASIETPIWAGLLANALRVKEKSVELIDLNIQSRAFLKAAVEDTQPKLIVFVAYGTQPSASTQTMHSIGLTARYLKEHFPECRILFTGPHPSALPELTLQQETCDYVAKGEGLNTIVGLLEGADLSKVPGLYYREMDQILHGPTDTVASDLVKTYPGVAWDLLPMSSYRASPWHCFGHLEDRNSYASIYTSLGCIYSCGFCMINAPFNGPGFRYWDVEFTANQIHQLVHKYGIKNIKYADEMHVLKEPHFMGLAKLLIEMGSPANIWTYARVDTIKPRHLDTLKKAGVNWVALGIESGSKYVRDGASKRLKQQDIVDVVKRIRDAGINVIANYIFGLRDDTKESMEETYALSTDLCTEMVNYYSAMGYPGSKLHDDAIAGGWKLPDSWLGYSQYSYECTPLPTNTLTGAEVLAFRDKAFHDYFDGIKYQEMIYDKFGSKTVRHIEAMVEIKLKRKLLGD